MKSKRSKKKRPTEFPVRLIKDGQARTISVPLNESFPLIPMVELGPPGMFPNRPHRYDLRHREYTINPFKVRDDEHLNHLAEKYGADEIAVDWQMDVVGFLRMIAKIAYCIAVWRFGLTNIGEAFVIPAILGTKDDVWQWVGSDGEQEIHEITKGLPSDHVVNVWFDGSAVIHGRVKLFKKSLTPEYDVIIGRLTDVAQGFYRSVGKL